MFDDHRIVTVAVMYRKEASIGKDMLVMTESLTEVTGTKQRTHQDQEPCLQNLRKLDGPVDDTDQLSSSSWQG